MKIGEKSTRPVASTARGGENGDCDPAGSAPRQYRREPVNMQKFYLAVAMEAMGFSHSFLDEWEFTDCLWFREFVRMTTGKAMCAEGAD